MEMCSSHNETTASVWLIVVLKGNKELEMKLKSTTVLFVSVIQATKRAYFKTPN